MKNQDYSASLKVRTSPHEAYQKISKVNEWWAKDFEGETLKRGDRFEVRFGDTWVDFEIKESEPDKKIVWFVTGCYLPWLNDKTEWNGTKVVWEIHPDHGLTEIKMTHIGLVPEVECYETCNAGWNRHIYQSLLKLLNENAGNPS